MRAKVWSWRRSSAAACLAILGALLALPLAGAQDAEPRLYLHEGLLLDATAPTSPTDKALVFGLQTGSFRFETAPLEKDVVFRVPPVLNLTYDLHVSVGGTLAARVEVNNTTVAAAQLTYGSSALGAGLEAETRNLSFVFPDFPVVVPAGSRLALNLTLQPPQVPTAPAQALKILYDSTLHPAGFAPSGLAPRAYTPASPDPAPPGPPAPDPREEPLKPAIDPTQGFPDPEPPAPDVAASDTPLVHLAALLAMALALLLFALVILAAYRLARRRKDEPTRAGRATRATLAASPPGALTLLLLNPALLPETMIEQMPTWMEQFGHWGSGALSLVGGLWAWRGGGIPPALAARLPHLRLLEPLLKPPIDAAREGAEPAAPEAPESGPEALSQRGPPDRARELERLLAESEGRRKELDRHVEALWLRLDDLLSRPGPAPPPEPLAPTSPESLRRILVQEGEGSRHKR